MKNIENLQGSLHDDVLKGDASDNILWGEAGNDVLIGGDGADVLDGGLGNNTASYEGSAYAVYVNLATGMTLGGSASGDKLVNIQNLIGSSSGDTLKGDDSANILDGKSGDDVLMGGDGDDVLIGGNGADVLDGGSGVNTASYDDSPVGVLVNLDSNITFGGFATGDKLVDIQNLIGSQFGDILRGDKNDNMLDGGAGDDNLAGHAGDDTFMFRLGYGHDTITDFVAGAGTEDKLLILDFPKVQSWADVLALATQVGSDTVIDFGGGDVLTLTGVNKDALSADDFTTKGAFSADLVPSFGDKFDLSQQHGAERGRDASPALHQDDSFVWETDARTPAAEARPGPVQEARGIDPGGRAEPPAFDLGDMFHWRTDAVQKPVAEIAGTDLWHVVNSLDLARADGFGAMSEASIGQADAGREAPTTTAGYLGWTETAWHLPDPILSFGL